MKKYTFRGGAHPLRHMSEGKLLTAGSPSREIPVPQTLIYPMTRGAGAPAVPCVQKGDHVLMGRKIGEAQGRISANVHATVSGTVKSVDLQPHPGGRHMLSVTVENDGQYEPDESVVARDPDQTAPADILAAIRELGVVGMGGAGFPTHVKLTPPEGRTIDTMIVNGAECEPYLTADHRLMLENPGDIADGIRIMRRVLPGVSRVFVGIELNKRDAIAAMGKALANDPCASVARMQVKYPQGAEKQLIYAITRRMVPSGGLPADVGVAVFNVGTAAAVSSAVRTGMPTLSRIVTVSGDAVRQPSNLRVRIGTPISECIAACGGTVGVVGKVIAGGPMMGVALPSDEAPVHAGTSGILVLSERAAAVPEPHNCIRCGRCVASCPLNMMPVYIAQAADSGDFALAEKLRAMDCVECGCCSYGCPSHRYLLQSIRLAKNQIRSKAGRK